jgi:phospholipid/cholesterol/gamma-HCH transport system substrate-binding protein
MRNARNNYVIVGIFLLAMLGALVGWMTILSGRTGATDPYYMKFQNVIGLAEGAQILYEGYPVGHIEEISLARPHDASAHRLDISIREGWKIPEDSVAVITQSGFLSPVVVDILGGSSTRMLAPGDRIESQGTTNLLTALASMSSTLGELTETSLKPLLDNLTEGTGSLENLFKDARDCFGEHLPPRC